MAEASQNQPAGAGLGPGKVSMQDLYKFGQHPNWPDLGMHQSNLNLMDNCAVKAGVSGVAGTAMGFVFGFFMGSMDSAHTMRPGYEKMTTKEQLVMTWKEMSAKSTSFAKNFGKIGLIYSAVECVIEKGRGSHDIYNPVMAGCVTGGALAISGGPMATLIGCGGFAAFSGAIELYMDGHFEDDED